MHALDKWIKENALSRKIFANKLKISVASLSRYLAGNRIPKQSIMEKIVFHTDGKVNPSNFYVIKNNNTISFNKYKNNSK